MPSLNEGKETVVLILNQQMMLKKKPGKKLSGSVTKRMTFDDLQGFSNINFCVVFLYTHTHDDKNISLCCQKNTEIL
jgi:hypothetical protein